MRQFKQRWMSLVVGGAMGGALMQFGGCFTDAATYISDINPCGTILNCDPVEYRFLTSGYEGPGADPSVDMTCTFPPYCGTATVPANDGPLP